MHGMLGIYVTSPNPTTPGRDVVDVHAHTDCIVCNCGSVRCKTCEHICHGSTFVSNVTNKKFSVLGSSSTMNCATDNLVYLISCKRWYTVCW